MKTLIVAEIGVNHNGSEDLAMRMIDAAYSCGADAVKFQTFSAEALVVKGAAKAEYQKNKTGFGDQYSMLKELEMSESMHRRLMLHCKDINMEFMSTPFDDTAAMFLNSLGVSRIKISSADITNHPFLAFLARFNKPLILSTGMSSLDEVTEAVSVIDEERKKCGYEELLPEKLVVLHCTSNYPTELDDVNLRAMLTMKEALGIPVGYSDHTKSILVAPIAVALGAVVIEKHFTLDCTLPGPDQKASLEPNDFREMVMRTREVESVLGDYKKEPAPSELPVRELVRRSLVLSRDMNAGEVLSRGDIQILRPGHGIPPKELNTVIGRKLCRSIGKGTVLEWSDVQ